MWSPQPIAFFQKFPISCENSSVLHKGEQVINFGSYNAAALSLRPILASDSRIPILPLTSLYTRTRKPVMPFNHLQSSVPGYSWIILRIKNSTIHLSDAMQLLPLTCDVYEYSNGFQHNFLPGRSGCVSKMTSETASIEICEFIMLGWAIIILLAYLNVVSFISKSFQIFIAISTVSGILKPFLAMLMAGLNSSFHGNLPYFFHAASSPFSSPGTATAKPPENRKESLSPGFNANLQLAVLTVKPTSKLSFCCLRLHADKACGSIQWRKTQQPDNSNNSCSRQKFLPVQKQKNGILVWRKTEW